ncbi:HAD-superfamily hydrolase, subfamily IB [Campylobacter iguaniorum]|uniref:HAD family hydrolase n=1 Tax=Campylobacter iguaniorum TaxID=1244531 RepID=UPI00073A2562|nr:HAD family hydrolase [Campylobacter iguaniorum]ALV24810.1 HAD-superfamily hydrolase, subfamily IB [Campylobacter iguaniorum]
MIYLYDLDKTLIKEDSAKLWMDFLCEQGLVGSEFVKAQEEYEDDYAKGILDMGEYQRHFLSVVKGKSVDELKPLLAKFVELKIRPVVYKGALDLIRRNGSRAIVISATNDFIVGAICGFLGIEEFVATNSQIKNGVYSGFMEGVPAFRDGKVERIKEILSGGELKKSVFYSDSINDLPLLKAAKTGILVNPDRLLLKLNDEFKFEIIKFDELAFS